MKKIKKYKYNGRNGTLITSILIEGATKIDMLCLIAEEGKILTNGEQHLYTVYVYPEDLDNWTETDDIGQV